MPTTEISRVEVLRRQARLKSSMIIPNLAQEIIEANRKDIKVYMERAKTERDYREREYAQSKRKARESQESLKYKLRQ